MIKRIPFDPPIDFPDIQGIPRLFKGIALSDRIKYLELKQAAIAAILSGNIEPCIQALELIGIPKDWVVAGDQSLIEDFMFGDKSTQSIIDSLEFPCHGKLPEESPALTNSARDDDDSHITKIWLTDMHGQRHVIEPLSMSGRQYLDELNGVIAEFKQKDIRENYDFEPDFRFAIDEILSLYQLSPSCINSDQLIDLMFFPGWLRKIETPLGEPGEHILPEDEDPYEAAIASFHLGAPTVPLDQLIRGINAIPWVQISGIVHSANRMSEDIGGRLDKGGGSDRWTAKEKEKTADLLDRFASGEIQARKIGEIDKLMGG